MIDLKIGAMILYKDMTAFLSKVQQWWWRVTARKYKAHSHGSVYIGKNTDIGRPQEAEANVWIDITTYHYNLKHQDIWIPKAREQHCKEAINEVLDELEESWYGFGAWLGIPIAGLIKIILPKVNVHKLRWISKIFGSGTHCTEFNWLIMKKIAEKEIIYKGTDPMQRTHWQQFYNALMQYNKDLFSPPDQVELMLIHSQCWEYVGNSYATLFTQYFLTKKQYKQIKK